MSPRPGVPGDRVRSRPSQSADRLLSSGQLVAGGLVAAVFCWSAVVSLRRTVIVVVGMCIAFYVLTAVLKLVITLAGKSYQPPHSVPVAPDDPRLPRYAVLLPVHKEANMLHLLVNRVQQLRYPRRQLRVMLLIEHDDEETLMAARALGIPFSGYSASQAHDTYLRVLVVPPGGPKTKPNALNAAMTVAVAEGCRYVTIYDAEDRPDADQLLKAVGVFRAADSRLGCLQAELAFWNDNMNWVTALYWVGYKIHYTRFLPGLARLGLPVPLGGTSNHFRVSALLDVALRPGGEVWDPNNLTEDADLGARLAAGGYEVDLLRSVTYEEAPVGMRVIDKQQRRWKAGYIQTGLVHTRRPLRAMRDMRPLRWLCFNLLILGVPITFMLNPLFLTITVAFFVTKATAIEELFPTLIYYPAVAVMLVGNLVVVYELLHTCLAEAEGAKGRYGLVWYMLLAELMWLWMSWSTYIAALELIMGKRTWHKTPHGHAEAEPPSGPVRGARIGRISTSQPQPDGGLMPAPATASPRFSEAAPYEVE
jgi:cellulose synthase/poly-beta-1,6-N-acetylglucosamine synthase-like glycosyltransferase